MNKANFLTFKANRDMLLLLSYQKKVMFKQCKFNLLLDY